MFNGIVHNTGIVKKYILSSKGLDLILNSTLKFNLNDIGSSLSCDGVCLTLVSFKNKNSRFHISKETLIRSKFKNLKIGDKINLEKPLKYGQNVSGHFIQGHVDTTAKVKKIKIIGKSWLIGFSINKKFIKQIVEKASISINGVSLTISNLKIKTFEICIIPHTLKLTNLVYIKKGDLVNIEIDLLSKYVKKFIK